MTFNQVLNRLKSKSNPAAVRGMARFGITAANRLQEMLGVERAARGVREKGGVRAHGVLGRE
jgi:hypothetical protein